MRPAPSVVFLERLDRHRLEHGWRGLPVNSMFEVHDGLITVWRDYFDLPTAAKIHTPLRVLSNPLTTAKRGGGTVDHHTARNLTIAALIPFTALTGVALWVDGIAGFPDAITHSWASAQIYVDLVLATVVLAVWMYRDARSNGRNPWPWIVAAAAVGMFSPLLYLLSRPSDD